MLKERERKREREREREINVSLIVSQSCFLRFRVGEWCAIKH